VDQLTGNGSVRQRRLRHASATITPTPLMVCDSGVKRGRVAKLVEIGGAGPEVAWWGGSGGEVKLGG
jgi:hypothetical protein